MHIEFPRMDEIFLALCEQVNSPISLGLWLRFKHDQLALANYDLPVRDYLSVESFELDYVCYSYLSKYKGLNTGLDLEAEALRRFESSESSCKDTNERLKRFRNGLTKGPAHVFHVAQRKIADLLGPYSPFCIEAGLGWGPGATDDIPRRRAFLDTKIREVPISVTSQALPLFRQILRADLHWSAVILGVNIDQISGSYCFLPHIFSITEENVVDTVPKNAKTHRVIAKEPRANAYLQKGFGAYIRKRLKRVGVDLDDQSRNQLGAKRAFADRLATLDLKAASDSMSVELVYELLPVDWALALDEVRSKRARLPDGRSIRLEKFSSMGNGFTFELESLLFWALASAVKETSSAGGEILVYGDDIVVPSGIADEVVAVLAFAGFTVNTAKSYISGNFFESCGRHYFKGIDVTPIYQKEVPNNVEELVRCGNRLIRLADRLCNNSKLRKELRAAWAICYRRRGDSGRYQLPLGAEGDDGWVVPADYFRPVAQDPSMGLKCKVYSKDVRRFPADELALLSWSLHSGHFSCVSSPPGLLRNDGITPFWGDVVAPPLETTPLRERRRWVMPTGDFGLTW